jgi:hypothetical protein
MDATHVKASENKYGFMCLTSYKLDVSCPLAPHATQL